MKQDKTSILIDYLEGRLPAEAQQRLEQELEQSEALRDELASLREVLTEMSRVSEEQPGPQMRRRFYDFLEKQEKPVLRPEKTAPVFRLRRVEWSVAAAVALLIIGIGFGTLWQRNLKQQEQINALVSEIEQTRKMMVLSMLEEPSASQRIKALNTVQEEPRGVDRQIIDALVNTLNTDDNVNVRAKAAEALLNYTEYPGVIADLTRSLQLQEHPEVQITLIEVLTASKAEGALDEFQRIIEQDEVHEVVRNKAAAGIQQLM